MNHAQLQGNWQQLQGKFREQWGKLTDDDLTQSQGRAEVLIGKLVERYGMKKDEAAQKFNQYLEKLEDSHHPLRAMAADVADMAHQASDKAGAMARESWQFAKKNPLATMGIAALMGAVLGALFFRRS